MRVGSCVASTPSWLGQSFYSVVGPFLKVHRQNIPWSCRLQGGWRDYSAREISTNLKKTVVEPLGRFREMTNKRLRWGRKPVGGVKATLGDLGESWNGALSEEVKKVSKRNPEGCLWRLGCQSKGIWSTYFEISMSKNLKLNNSFSLYCINITVLGLEGIFVQWLHREGNRQNKVGPEFSISYNYVCFLDKLLLKSKNNILYFCNTPWPSAWIVLFTVETENCNEGYRMVQLIPLWMEWGGIFEAF